MASKKYTFLVAVLVMLQIAGNAQTKTDWGWDWKDSSKVPTKSIPQYNEFLNNQYPYPPKPRNAWELGFTLGHSIVVGDIPLFTKSNGSTKSNDGGYVVGISLRKSISHLFSLRSSFYFSQSSIPAIAGKNAFVKNTMFTGSLDGIFSINSLSFYRGNPKFDWYGLAGGSLILLSAKDVKGNKLSLSGANTLTKAGTSVIVPTINFGGGVAYKINNKLNIGVEQKYFLPTFGYDYLDGFRPTTGYSAPDILSFTTVRLNINIGN